MIYYLILDKSNKIVKEFTNKEDAEKYVSERPYLKIEEFKI
tara:strand:+ start:1093 stop:1215 length:123 start_codon:yes stop_codon:yes gene_type:complete